MEQDDLDRVRQALHQRPKPSWRVLWRGVPDWPASAGSPQPLRQRRSQLHAGWKLLWAERLRRDLAPIYRHVACRHGRHRDVHLMADDLIGSALGEDYPQAAICEVCGRIVEWPNGRPILVSREQE